MKGGNFLAKVQKLIFSRQFPRLVSFTNLNSQKNKENMIGYVYTCCRGSPSKLLKTTSIFSIIKSIFSTIFNLKALISHSHSKPSTLKERKCWDLDNFYIELKVGDLCIKGIWIDVRVLVNIMPLLLIYILCLMFHQGLKLWNPYGSWTFEWFLIKLRLLLFAQLILSLVMSLRNKDVLTDISLNVGINVKKLL